MRDWPHSPIHRLSESGTFMVTAGTYKKAPSFSTARRLEFLSDTLLQVAKKYGWQLQAWAIFPNHYHFVGGSPGDAESLRPMVQELHSLTGREANRLDQTPGQKVWFEYWETRITFEKSFLARLSYVHGNAVHHGLVRVATDYPWCSAGWFERRAQRAFYRTVVSFTGKGIKVPDDFVVAVEDVAAG